MTFRLRYRRLFAILLLLLAASSLSACTGPRTTSQKLVSGRTIRVISILSACTGPRTTSQKLVSGRTIRVISIAPMTFKESGPALIFKYQTDIKLDQMQPLSQEVDEIWADFKPQAEKAGVKGVAVSANEAPHGWPIYTNKAFTFVFVKQPDGTWKRSPSEVDATDYVGRYTKPGNASDYMDIKTDGTFVALDKGQSLSGTYTVTGTTITLEVPSAGGHAVGRIEPGKIIDNDGQTWVKAAAPQATGG